MKISFHGAAREVTGSCILVETKKTKFLVDCGIFQGGQFATDKNLEPFAFNPKEIDFVLLTHAHMDHTGRLPKLHRDGFRGKIYTTEATKDFAGIMLLDSARVILKESSWRKVEPVYKEHNVKNLLPHFTGIDYNKKIKLTPDITIMARDAGHILGSAIFEVWIKDGLKTKKIVFSGDLGNPPAPILRDTEFVDGADFVVMESTYGGRIHEPRQMSKELLQKAILGSVGRGGVLMIPAFALERTQELLYELNLLVEEKDVPVIPIFVDSPLAIKATEVYKQHEKMYDKESLVLINSGDDLFHFPGLKFTRTVDQSKKINTIKPPKVIIAGSGMCVGGRIPHHLKFNLGDTKNHLLFIGYQVQGSLGRKLFDGAKSVTIHGEKVRVRAKVSAIGSYSAHADQPKLLHWVKMMKKQKPKKVFIVHGEEKANLMLADGLKEKLKITSVIPEYGQSYDI